MMDLKSMFEDAGLMVAKNDVTFVLAIFEQGMISLEEFFYDLIYSVNLNSKWLVKRLNYWS